jgi:DMSO/TMAO reductase YedYZ molybdopterin-dependent catalytic subunit
VDPQDLRSILGSWRLTVDGMVENPRTFTWEELIGLTRQDQVTDFHCVEGWSVYDVPWNGVHLSTIFEVVRPRPEATYVAFHTIDGRYNESLPRTVALEPRTLLAYGIHGNTLPLAHGFPARVVVPRLLAYKSAKYVDRIELTDRPLIGFWVAAGYPYDAEVPPSRLRPGKY